MLISLIVATDENNAIGNQNRLLCHLPADLKYFKQTTSGHHIVMGRKTYESIGRPLPNRVNIVLSSNPNLELDGCVIQSSLIDAVDLAQHAGETELFITGGGTIYNQALSMAHRIYLTRIHHAFEADTYFPKLGHAWTLVKQEDHPVDEKNAYPYTFEVYERNPDVSN